MLKSVVKEYSLAGIPPVVKRFLLRALIIFICWKLLYHPFLFPVRVPDKQLTHITADVTAWVYKIIIGGEISITETPRGEFPKAIFYINGQRGIGIADPCNGLELYVLYIGFLFCLPQPKKKMLLYITGGLAVIFVLNILRCVALAWLNLHDYAVADFAHHYLFKMIVYGVIFYLWVLYSKKVFRDVS